jgi:hypothetical protein
MVFVFLLFHFAPSIYWGATGSTIIAPALWSLVGAAYSAIIKWRGQNEDIMSAHAFATGRGASMILGAAFTCLLFSGVLNLVGYFIGQTVMSSSGLTRIVEAVVIAYSIAGLHHVLCDLRQPIIRQPANVRRGSSSMLSMTIHGLAWLPASIFNLRWAKGRIFLDAVFSWVLFGALTCALFLL